MTVEHKTSRFSLRKKGLRSTLVWTAWPRNRLVFGDRIFLRKNETMFIVQNFFAALAVVIDLVLTAYFYIVIARAILSWVNPDPYNPIVRFLYNVTEPVLRIIRRRIPAVYGGVDFAPMIVILAIYFLQRFLVPSIAGIGMRMGMGM